MDTHGLRNLSTEPREKPHFYAGRQVQSAPFIGEILEGKRQDVLWNSNI